MSRFEMDATTLAQLSQLLDEALERPPAARDAWVEALGPQFDALKPHLRDLLSRSGAIETGDFLHTIPKIHADVARTPESTVKAGEVVGPYRLVRELGAGGMGAVWLAERVDGLIQRKIALKLPHIVTPRRTELAERMAREREILATLDHPNIARLFDAGLTAEGQPYLALEYVEGVPIDRHCLVGTGDGPLPVAARLRLFLQVANAVAYAHGKLVVHRDLKPANVLVTPSGEVRLLDFGIAKLLESGEAKATQLTQFSGSAFTPDYASPEQILGEPLTVASDVYSLGVILYELLSGARPYKLARDSRGALEDAILEADPTIPSDAAPADRRKALRGDLDTIVLKALKKNPRDRYATVNALAEDVARHLENRPLLARPDTARYRLRKFIVRNRFGVTMATLVSLVAIAGAVLVLWQARVAVAERDRAEEVKRFIVEIFRDADPYQVGGGQLSGAGLLRTAQTRIATQFADRPELRIELLTLVGSSLKSLNDLDNAEIALKQAIDEGTRLFGPDHLQTLRARVLLTDVFNTRRDVEKLGPEIDALLPRARAVFREDPELLIRLLIFRGDENIEFGKYDVAEAAAREAFTTARRALGDSNPLTVQASNLQADAIYYANERAEAQAYLPELERAVRFASTAFAAQPNHPLVLYIRDIRSRTLSDAGFFAESVVEATRVVDGMRATLGEDNIVYANAALSLSGTERRMGLVTRALGHAGSAIATIGNHVDHHSRDWAAAQATYAVVLMSARRPAEAEQRLHEAQAIFTELIGADSGDARNVQGSRLPCLAYLGRDADLARGIKMLRSGSKEGNMNWAVPYLIGIAQRLRGHPREALVLQEEAANKIAAGPRRDWSRIRVATEIGLDHLEAGDADDAEKALQEAMMLAEKLGIQLHPELAEVTTALGRVELLRGAPQRAVPHLEKSHKFWSEFDPRNPLARETALWLGRTYVALGRPDEGLPLLATPKTEWR